MRRLEWWRGLPTGEYGFPGPLRDRLVQAIVAGHKTSSTALVIDHVVHDEPLPRVGDREVVVDSWGCPVVVTENTDVTVRRVADVPLAHTLAEGEGFGSIASWREAHEEFWHSNDFRAAIGTPDFRLDDDTEVVCISFRVIEVLCDEP